MRSNLLRGGALKEHEAGLSVAELGRKHGIRRPAGVCLQTPKGNDAALYKWWSKYGGMEVSEAKRLKQLEDDNAKLKKLLAEAMMRCMAG